MNPKLFLAFAAGVFVAGGAAYFVSRPAAVVVSPAVKTEVASAVAQAVPELPVTPDRVISSARPVEAEPVAAKPRRVASPERPVSKPSPVAVAKVREPIPVVNPVVEVAAAPSQPLKIEVPPPPPPSIQERPVAVKAPPEPPKANSVTITTGTVIQVRLRDSLSTERNKPGDSFSATIDQPIVVDGFVIAERGSRVEGRITELDRSGRVKGLARMALELTKMTTSDGQQITIQTSAFERKAEDSKKKDAAKVGIGAAIGAVIGGIAGGGKGAGAGAGAGGAIGAGDVLLTRGTPVELASETRLSFRLQEPVVLTEKLQ